MSEFYPGFDIMVDQKKLLFVYGKETFGPKVEQRYLNDIRNSLRDPEADGPEIPYVIAMDVGKKEHLTDLKKRHLLYGAMIYSKGQIGEEPVRSQGHVHSASPSCRASTPEVYEIWQGKAIIYMQEKVEDDPGKCFAIWAKEGEVVIVPPNWAHFTVNADPSKHMAFGAWCIRDYGFDYKGVRAHGGLAYFPIVGSDRSIQWICNKQYDSKEITEKNAREYSEFGLKKGIPIYKQYEDNNELFTFVTNPVTAADIWKTFEP